MSDVTQGSAASLAAELFKEHRDELVVERQFGLFATLARDHLKDDSPAAPTAPKPGVETFWAEVLYQLLLLTATDLGGKSKVAAALALDAYIVRVVPRLTAVGQPTQPVLELATSLGVLSFLSKLNLRTLLESAQAADETAKSRPPVAPEPVIDLPGPANAPGAATGAESAADAQPESSGGAQTTEQQTQQALAILHPMADAGPDAGERYDPEDATEADRAATEGRTGAPSDDQIAAVDYDAILRTCVAAQALNRRVVVVVGLATTGKSFFVGRLKRALAKGFTWSALKGVAGTGRQAIPRTKDVLLYRFTRIAKPRSSNNFDVYDVPGDLFIKLVRNGFVVAGDDRDTVRLLYGIFTFADAIIFIAPSLQVLMRDTFLRSGDDLGLKREEREERARDIQTFIQSLDPLTRVITLLKQQYRIDYKATGSRMVKPRAFKAQARTAAGNSAVSAIMELDFEQIQNRSMRSGRLPIPALLLLSRADELRARLPEPARAGFDYDPTYQLLARGREHLDNLAARFDAFSVDFLTAEAGHQQGNDFEPDNPSFGAAELIENWLLPAIKASRRFGLTRRLQGPDVALWLRRRLDPDFQEAWRRDTPMHD